MNLDLHIEDTQNTQRPFVAKLTINDDDGGRTVEAEGYGASAVEALSNLVGENSFAEEGENVEALMSTLKDRLYSHAPLTDLDTLTKGLAGPFEPWESDHTGLVHVLWSADHENLTIKDADQVASMILASRWMAATLDRELSLLNEDRLKALPTIQKLMSQAWKRGRQDHQNDLGAADITPDPYAPRH